MKDFLKIIIITGSVYYLAEYHSLSLGMAALALGLVTHGLKVEQRLEELTADSATIFEKLFSKNSNL